MYGKCLFFDPKKDMYRVRITELANNQTTKQRPKAEGNLPMPVTPIAKR
jgi:hypothetical protein